MRITQALFNYAAKAGLVVIASGTTALLVSAGGAIAQLTVEGSLTVNISGLKNTEGQVCFSLHESAQGFPEDESAVVAQQCVSAASAVSDEDDESSEREADITVTFAELEAGTYAVSVLHDENEDQQINQGSFGIPTEGFGFSRNPMVQTGAPEFAEAAVVVFGSTTTDIEMIYF